MEQKEFKKQNDINLNVIRSDYMYKAITLNHFLKMYVDSVLEQEEPFVACLKDGDGNFHKITEVDLLRDRICCDDEFFDYYEYIMENELGENHKLFKKIKIKG